MLKRKTRRVIAIGDTHCGHIAGLTPPDWQFKPDVQFEYRAKLGKMQAEAWAWYAARVKEMGPADVVLFNGDAIDGRGERSGGTELSSGDRNEQAQMAVECIRPWKGKAHIFTRGTPYHTGDGEDFEDQIAREFGGKIGNHEWPSVNGVVYDLKHKIGSSSVPHGRLTALARSALWNSIWAEAEGQPRAQILLRSHVHYHVFGGGEIAGHDVLAMTLPALQMAHTKYGARQCEGTVHFGVTMFDITPAGSYSWQCRRARLSTNRAKPTVL
jgi:hypothetical protein